MALANEDLPVYVAPAFELIASAYIDEPKITDAFQSGAGVGWHEHHECLFRGTEKFFRPGYRANLVPAWLPALEGVVEKLLRGGKVADIGCGAGASTIIMARAFPSSHFIGIDYHDKSIARAREAAAEEGHLPNIEFEVATAKEAPGTDFDLVCTFDCLHDMGDPVGAARHVREMLKRDGTFMIVEPMAGDRLGRKPKSGRADVLFGLDDDLHARLESAGGRARARRSSRRGQTAQRARRSGFHPCPPRCRNAFQPGDRSQAVAQRAAQSARV